MVGGRNLKILIFYYIVIPYCRYTFVSLFQYCCAFILLYFYALVPCSFVSPYFFIPMLFCLYAFSSLYFYTHTLLLPYALSLIVFLTLCFRVSLLLCCYIIVYLYLYHLTSLLLCILAICSIFYIKASLTFFYYMITLRS